MELPLNIIATLVPNICEAAHERLPPHRPIHGGHRCLQQPCNNGHSEVFNARRPRDELRVEKQSARTRIPPNGFVSTSPITSFSQLNPSPISIPTASDFSIPDRKELCAECLSTHPKDASSPRKRPIDVQDEVIPSIPSASSLVSLNITQNSPEILPCASPAPPASVPITPQNDQGRAKGENIGGTSPKAHVKTVAAHAREIESSTSEETEFFQRLRKWDAEMKLRRMEEDPEDETDDEEGHTEGGCSDRGMSWIGQEHRMSSFRNTVWERRKPSWKGLAVALER